jgi:pimeloyl-ACP methyl ester carboxylesterase
LFGTLHRPRQPRPDLPAVVMLSPGVKMRVGPGRLYVPLTDMLNVLGYTVLRFDFFGLGDSEGELDETQLADVYNHIEVGRYVEDSLAALAFLRDQHGIRRFVLGGLCGGAITALLTAERDRSVEGLLSIGMTVTLASNAATPARYLTGQQLDMLRAGYLRNLGSWRSWLRLLTFQSDYGVIWHSLMRRFRKPAPRPAVAAAPASAPAPAPAAQPTEQRGDANPLFPRAYFTFLGRGGRALMLFSEKDRLYSQYHEKFAEPFREQLRPYLPQIEEHVIANANHVLSFRPWQTEMLERSRAWLAGLHGPAGATP